MADMLASDATLDPRVLPTAKANCRAPNCLFRTLRKEKKLGEAIART
jgi:hypothetical protein